MKVEQSLLALDRYIRRRWRELPDYDSRLSFVEYDYLDTLGERGVMRLSELAEKMRVSKPSASNMIARLERKGLVLCRPCPEDGRAVNLTLSPKGQQLLNIDEETFSKINGELLQEMSSEDQASLEVLLSRMVAQIAGK